MPVDVYPNDTTHSCDSLDCYCNPQYAVPCDECDGEGCWKCDDGLISLTREDAEELQDYESVVVIHNSGEQP